MKKQLPLFLLILLFSAPVFASLAELNQLSKKTQSMFRAEKYAEAEPLVRGALKEVPEDLYWLSQLDVSLNGQGKHKEADKVRDKILEIWNRLHKADWLAKGSPKNRAAWVRTNVPSKHYYVLGTQYYIPEVIGDKFGITSFYKFIVFPKNNKTHKPRLFKLEMSKMKEEYYVLREQYEGGGAQLISYGNKKPPLQKVGKDLIKILNAK